MVESHKHPPAVFLMGPTACGKTGLAIELVKRYPFEIISVDSSLVYRRMDIGTAKPSAEELVIAPHRLIDIREPSEPYSVADFCVDARKEMRSITDAGKIPLLVGGTMFYFNSLEFGLSKLPAADPEIRKILEQEIKANGLNTLHERLSRLDPESGARIHKNDTQRIERALEIIEITGQTPTQLAVESSKEVDLPYQLLKLALWPEDRDILRERIAQRFDAMLEQGLIAEVEGLLKSAWFDPSLPSMRMVGYRQVLEHLQGVIDFEAMRERAIIATRQLAKRQMTWLRGYSGIERLGCSDSGLSGQNENLISSKMSDLGIY